MCLSLCEKRHPDCAKIKTAVQISLVATADRRYRGLDRLFHGALMQSVFDLAVKSHHRWREQQAAQQSDHQAKRTHIGAQISRAS